MRSYKFNLSGNANFLILIAMLFLFPRISEASLTININIDIPDNFNIGEKIFFNYSITSDTPTKVTFIPYINCPTAPVPLLTQKTITLDANVPYTDTYTDIVVEDFIEPQTCIAYVEILNPIQKRVEKQFRIETKPSFELNILTCKDHTCTEKSKVFVQDKDIYLDYSTEVENLSISATLIYPDKTTKQITLPTSIKANQIGTYTLKVTASKEGYKTKTLSTQFGVIEKEAEIINTSSCFVNGKCEPDLRENYKTCPQDCKPCAKDGICNPNCLPGEDADCKQISIPYYILIISLIIVLFLLIISVKH